MRPIVRYLIGHFLMLEGIFLLVPLFVAIYDREPAVNIFAFGFAAVLAGLSGWLLSRRKPVQNTLYAKDGLILCSLTWIAFSLIGSLPIWINGDFPLFIDAFFEIVSGFTTTGATVQANIEGCAKSTLFWRSFTHFIGGMGVLVFSLAILPATTTEGSVFMAKAEMPGPSFSKISARLSDVARILYAIYTGMTIVLTGLLIAFGMNGFDALCHAMGTAGTGGFSTRAASVGAYDSVAIQTTIGIFMLLYSVNFNLYYLLLLGRTKDFFKNTELHGFFRMVGISIVLIYLVNYGFTWNGRNLLNVFFSVSTLASSTGYVTVDYDVWPLFSQLILIGIMFVGACGGSTGGGLKVSRVQVLIKSSFQELKQIRNPNRVQVLRYEGETLEGTKLRSILLYFGMFTIIFVTGLLIISLDVTDFRSAFSTVLTAISNMGPGLGTMGPTEHMQSLSIVSKITMCALMITGRLEIWPVLILFSRKTWRNT